MNLSTTAEVEYARKLRTLRRQYRAAHCDRWTKKELARLMFVRWLYQSGGIEP